ncbi:MAG: sulfatase-like hydrolase/transferase [Pontiellaceae bacterium]
MKILFKFILCFFVGFTFSLKSEEAVSTPPNIIFIFADDMAFETISGHGETDIDTPNLDRLLKKSTRFTRAYNMGAWNGAVCIASRTMLLTGKTVWNAYSIDSAKEIHKLGQLGQTWPQWLKNAGYQTYMSGKWHIKNDPSKIFDVTKDIRPGMPQDLESGYNRPKNIHDYNKGWKPWDITNGGFWEGGTHWSEVLANNGVEFIYEATKTEDPFFMYLAFNAPHDPRQAPKSFIDLYPLDRIKVPVTYLEDYPYSNEIGCGPSVRDERLAPFPRTKYAVKINRQEYYALITHMDEQIGRILDALDKSGKADSTYIIFTADHGLAVGHHGFMGKQNLYEHSTKVPFLVCGPDINKNHVIDEPIYLQDVMPTTLDLAGLELSKTIQFKSLLPLLKGERVKHYPSIYGGFKGIQRSITQDNWKLIYYTYADKYRLYNLSEDPFEMNDLSKAETQKSRLNEMKKNLIKLSEELNDPLNYEEPEASWNKVSSK